MFNRRWTIPIGVLVAVLTLSVLVASLAFAVGGDQWADSVESLIRGGTVASTSGDFGDDAAIGPNDGQYTSLGDGGVLTLDFDDNAVEHQGSTRTRNGHY